MSFDGLPLLDGTAEVDSSALNENSRKLGLGSSAAATVRCGGRAAGGDRPRSRGNGGLSRWRSRCGPIARRKADAARAATWRPPSSAESSPTAVPAVDRPAVRPLPELLPGELVVFAAGGPIATVDHLQAVERLAARDPEVHARRLREIAEAADAFIAAHERSDAEALIDAVSRSPPGARRPSAERPTFPSSRRRWRQRPPPPASSGGQPSRPARAAATWASRFFPDPDSAAAFRGRASPLNLPILSIKIGAPGLTQQDERRPERLHVE